MDKKSSAETKWKIEGNNLYLAIRGKLDTLEAMKLDDRLGELPEEVTGIFFDFDGLQYIASAGLRILYWAQEYAEEKGGRMKVRNVSDEVLEILDTTGFKDLIDIE
jgi:anti-anti-sigma factor